MVVFISLCTVFLTTKMTQKLHASQDALLMFSGMSSLSTMPFTKPIHLGMRSLNSLMNTLR